ncbi:MAG: hypothetical protein IKK29_03080 [Christensenellaceae bacterium]|nr:hypothetical protein [Christensenellaceae bacterium]
MLRMMQVTADAPMMIFLNGQPAGEFAEGEVYLPVGEGTLFFQAFPMRGGLLPVTAKLELTGEDTHCVGPDTLKLFLLSGSIRVQICFEKIPGEETTMPYVLRRISLGNELYAAVYFDRVFCFSLERSGRVIVGGAFLQKIASAEIYRRGNMVIFSGSHDEGKEFFVVALGQEPRVTLHRDVMELSVGEEQLEYACRLMQGVSARERFGLREGRVLSREIDRGGAPLLSALAAGIREGAEDYSMRLIHPLLRREASFSDFCEFFGDFTDADIGETGNILELCYETERNVYRVRRLRASIKDEQIANIAELEE